MRSFETFSVFLKYLFDQIDYLVSKKYVIDLMSMSLFANQLEKRFKAVIFHICHLLGEHI
jgi:hypothetical protein